MVALQASRMLGMGQSAVQRVLSMESAYFCAAQVLPVEVLAPAAAVEVTDWAVATAAKAAMAAKNFMLL
jgi:hypothetical protein